MAGSAEQWGRFGLETGVFAAEAALWAEATSEDGSVPIYLGKSKSVEAAGKTRWYSWGWGASHPAVGVAAEEALRVPVTENTNAGHETSITAQLHLTRI
jgi:hypothetical protein